MSRGPATLSDFAKWSGLTIIDARRGLDAVRAQLQVEVAGSQTLWFSASRRWPKRTSPVTCLLSIYDEYMSGYRDDSAMPAPKSAPD